MAKYVNQIRYYKEGSSKNSPQGLKRSQLSGGTAFKYNSQNSAGIVQLGIQTLPGVQFVINTSSNPITVGSTGIYELNVDGLTTINSLNILKQSLDMIDKNENAYLIVDYVYEKE